MTNDLQADHQNVDKLRSLLPKSVLHPPRHSLNIPFPTSSLSIHTGQSHSDPTAASLEKKKDQSKANTVNLGRLTSKQAETMMPHIHYAPIHVKGITTTLPADGNAKKQKRLEEVRKRRREVKAQRRTKKG